MKRILAFALATVMLLCFTACGMQDIAQTIGEQKNKAVERGTIDGNTFTSAYADLTFTKPDAWTYATDAELAETMDLGSETLDQTAFEKAAVTMTSVYDMMVTDYVTGNKLCIMYENLKLSGTANITNDEYFDEFDKQFIDRDGMKITTGERQTVKLGKNDYYRASYAIDYNGISLTDYVYIRKIENHMHIIIAALTVNQTAQSIEAMFS